MSTDINDIAQLRDFCIWIVENPDEYQKFKKGLETFISDIKEMM